jgi:hypothetical protein
MSYRDDAIRAFCKLRRLQEANESGYVHCITCGAVVKWNECDGGHFIPRGKRGTEVEADNVWPQCVSCNRFHAVTRKEYLNALTTKIGEERVKALEAKAKIQGKKDYMALTRFFEFQVRQLRKEKGL